MTFYHASKTEAETRIAALRKAAVQAGAQRRAALAALAAIGAAHAFTVSYGQSQARLSALGAEVVAKDAVLDAGGEVLEAAVVVGAERTFIHPALRAAAPVGSAGLNKVVQGMPIPYGVCVIVAGSGAGKTPLAHYLAGEGVDGYGIVRVGEPFAGYTTNPAEAALAIGAAALAYSDVVVDSIKDLLAQSGAAMKGGIARSALADLSFWSILGATLGVTFYVPLNPSSGDKETLDMLVEVAKSNTSLTVSRLGDGGAWSFTARPGEGLERVTGSISGPGRDVVSAIPEKSTDLSSARDPVELGRDILAGAMSRSLVKG